jgi:hypothetical protein
MTKPLEIDPAIQAIGCRLITVEIIKERPYPFYQQVEFTPSQLLEAGDLMSFVGSKVAIIVVRMEAR